MIIYARGTAIIEHHDSGEQFEIYDDELDWEPAGGDDRGMGPETIYEALIEHDELGDLRWTISEYPAGAENFKETNVGMHRVIQDFDYGLEHEPEFDDEYPANLRDRFKNNPEWTKAMTKATVVKYLVDWFHYFYEDPANETPYNGREGGYLYIKGGPYSAEEELRENFEDVVPEDAILVAVDEIQSDGLFDWAPSHRHPDSIDFYEDAVAEDYAQDKFSFEALKEIASESQGAGLGSEEEKATRAAVLEQIAALRGSVAKLLGPRDFPVGRLYIFPSRSCAGEDKMIDFKGVHHPKSVILYAVFFYLRYAVSYRDLEEIMAERGVRVDHATLNRWVVKFSPLIAARAQARKRSTATSWRVDETYIKVKGKWRYLYRAVDRDGQTLDFMLSHRRDLAAARRFFKQAIAAHGVPDRVVIDKSGANLAGLQAVNVILKFTGDGRVIEVRQVKYLNNILEQDHRFIKRITNPMMGFKAFHSAAATIAGIEAAHMIRKGQIPTNGTTPFQTFASLAA